MYTFTTEDELFYDGPIPQAAPAIDWGNVWADQLKQARNNLRGWIAHARAARTPGSVYNNAEQIALADNWVNHSLHCYRDTAQKYYGVFK